MRGKAFHNKIVENVEKEFRRCGWNVFKEYRYRRHGMTTYLDILAVKDFRQIACEIETTSRHAVDNAKKAQAAGIIDLWIIVSSRKLLGQIKRKLLCSNLSVDPLSIRILLPDSIETELERQELQS